MLIFVDREEKIQVFGFLFLLFTYTLILVSRILYAKKVWHKEFNDENYAKDVIKDCMTSVSSSDYHTFSIPLKVNINSGYNWGEAH